MKDIAIVRSKVRDVTCLLSDWDDILAIVLPDIKEDETKILIEWEKECEIHLHKALDLVDELNVAVADIGRAKNMRITIVARQIDRRAQKTPVSNVSPVSARVVATTPSSALPISMTSGQNLLTTILAALPVVAETPGTILEVTEIPRTMMSISTLPAAISLSSFAMGIAIEMKISSSEATMTSEDVSASLAPVVATTPSSTLSMSMTAATISEWTDLVVAWTPKRISVVTSIPRNVSVVALTPKTIPEVARTPRPKPKILTRSTSCNGMSVSSRVETTEMTGIPLSSVKEASRIPKTDAVEGSNKNQQKEKKRRKKGDEAAERGARRNPFVMIFFIVGVFGVSEAAKAIRRRLTLKLYCQLRSCQGATRRRRVSKIFLDHKERREKTLLSSWKAWQHVFIVLILFAIFTEPSNEGSSMKAERDEERDRGSDGVAKCMGSSQATRITEASLRQSEGNAVQRRNLRAD